jgi:hypothetical protein
VEVEKYFTYHKGWRNRRINSLFFDDVMTYQNPTRDPFPSVDYIASDVNIGGYRISGHALATSTHAHGTQSVQNTRLGADAAEKLSNAALREGFSEVGVKYIYSRVPKDGWTSSLLKKAARYMVDGVVDLGDLGTCKAGDIRISFKSEDLVPVISVIAQRVGDRLVPYTSKTHTSAQVLIAHEGSVSASAMCARASKESVRSARWKRLYIGAFAFGAWILYLWDSSASQSCCTMSSFIQHFVLPVLYAVITIGVPSSIFFLYFWGVRDTLRTAAMLVVLPVVAAVYLTQRQEESSSYPASTSDDNSNNKDSTKAHQQ